MGKPEKVFRAGNCSASIFVNEIEKEDKKIAVRKVVLDVGYKDDKGKWQSTKSIDQNEIPRVMLVLSKAYEWLAIKRNQDTEKSGNC
jgi:hypothetical protein